jgi:hypothetical protein
MRGVSAVLGRRGLPYVRALTVIVTLDGAADIVSVRARRLGQA